MKRNLKYPLRHLSIRVPWHDNAWNGTICSNPRDNGACLVLKNCSQNRDDELESNLAGKSIKGLNEDQYPTCVYERGTFMSNFSFTKHILHPYKILSPDTHGHIKATPIIFNAYSAGAIPFHWLNKDSAQEISDRNDLDLDLSREPSDIPFQTGWVNEYQNQKVLFDCYFGHIEPETSLCFFYAKQVPFVETSNRVLIGMGRIKKVGDSVEYDYESKGGLRTLIWEHIIKHSIRSNNKDGFLLPYHQALEYSKSNPEFDPAEIAVQVPNENRFEFSYASEHVSHDTAIYMLLESKRVLELCIEKGIGKNLEASLKWIHDRLIEIEKLRGPYPGLGSALTAFGLQQGHFIATHITENYPSDKIWDAVGAIFNDPRKNLPQNLSRQIGLTLIKKYKLHKSKNTPRYKLLQLISRFDLNREQAEGIYVKESRQELGFDVTDEELLDNPYRIFEATYGSTLPIDLKTIDLGIFSNQKEENLQPESLKINDPLDSKRIRALTFRQLEFASSNGNTLLSRTSLVNQIRKLSLKPECKVDGDIYELVDNDFEGVIERVQMNDGSPAYQQKRLRDISGLIKEKVMKRHKGKRHKTKIDWRNILDNKLAEEGHTEITDTEEKARYEKSIALKELAESRFAVLLGPAGTGKTTLLSILCSVSDIIKGGILFLAPTGKARVRMQQAAKDLEIPAYTIAQFLGRHSRYDGNTQRYHLSNEEREKSYATVIVDESSMLTEEMLGALFDCLEGVQRFILVGDHRQLPPIGSGRPFVDIIKFLEPEKIESTFPKVGKCYAELTIRRRQRGKEREDLLFANWFTGNPIPPGEDSIFDKVVQNNDLSTIRMINWNNESDIEEKLEKVLVEELKLNNSNDIDSFNLSLGSTDGFYFNKNQAVEKVDAWQILSPVKEKVFGVRTLNRTIHKKFKGDQIKFARERYKIPRPLGLEEIVYGDKVINVYNHNRKDVYPKDGMSYVANGEIGIVVGQFKNKYHKFKGKPKWLEIEYSSQKGFVYTFKPRDFKEEGNDFLELAYALTVHKSQGSEFDLVILILPNPLFILSRELLYTALTRQKTKVVVLYQGDLHKLKEYSSDLYSDTLRRLTNIFTDPQPIKIRDRYLEQNLIHCASDRTLLRSKSELIIYQRLLEKNVKAMYEKELMIKDVIKIPDFTIEDSESGTVYYWEHCGMMNNPEYAARWKGKKEWYMENGILEPSAGEGENGTLLVTEETDKGAISIPEIDRIIEKYLI